MTVRFEATALPGVIRITPDIFRDERGCFMETYHRRKYEEGGIRSRFVQDNRSRSSQGVLRGLHYQLRHPQAKLVYAVTGEIFDVAVDLRRQSDTFGKWVAMRLSEENRRQMFIPEGFAHGFCVVSPWADVVYKCSDFYFPDDDYGLLWSDPEVKIDWPLSQPVLSEKDRQHPPLSEISEADLPVVGDTE